MISLQFLNHIGVGGSALFNHRLKVTRFLRQKIFGGVEFRDVAIVQH